MAVLGVIKGFSRLPKDFREAVQNMGDTLFIHMNYSFNKAVKQTVKYAVELAGQKGGVDTDNELIIKIQKPRPLKLEVAFPKLVFDHRATVFEKDDWKFKGNWMKYCGKADIFIDGKFKRTIDEYFGCANQIQADMDSYITNLLPGNP